MPKEIIKELNVLMSIPKSTLGRFNAHTLATTEYMIHVPKNKFRVIILYPELEHVAFS